jgi:hypothetical protein
LDTSPERIISRTLNSPKFVGRTTLGIPFNMDALPIVLGTFALVLFIIGVAALINLSTKKENTSGPS